MISTDAYIRTILIIKGSSFQSMCFYGWDLLEAITSFKVDNQEDSLLIIIKWQYFDIIIIKK